MSSIAWSISSAVCCHIHRESASEHLQGQGSDTQLRVEHSAMDSDFGWANSQSPSRTHKIMAPSDYSLLWIAVSRSIWYMHSYRLTWRACILVNTSPAGGQQARLLYQTRTDRAERDVWLNEGDHAEDLIRLIRKAERAKTKETSHTHARTPERASSYLSCYVR